MSLKCRWWGQEFEDDSGRPLIARLPEQLQQQVQAKLERLKLTAAAAASDEEDRRAAANAPKSRNQLTAEARTRQLQDRLGGQSWERYVPRLPMLAFKLLKWPTQLSAVRQQTAPWRVKMSSSTSLTP